MNQRMTRIAQLTRKALDGHKGGFVSHAYQVVRLPHGNVQVIYRGTVVASFSRSGSSVVLQTRGWFTPTTKAVINAALAHTPYSVYQKDWEWFVCGFADGHIENFREGMMLVEL